MKKLSVFLLLLSVAVADEASVEKQRQLLRYFDAVPPEETMRDFAQRGAEALDPSERARFGEILTKYLDASLFKAAIADAMLRNLTTNEIKALADFYGSKDGKSAQKKMGTLVAQALPVIMKDFERASARYDQEHISK